MTYSQPLDPNINTTQSHYIPPRKGFFYSYIFSIIMVVLYTRTQSSLIGYINVFVILISLCYATKQESFLLLMGLQFLERGITVNFGSSAMSFLLFAYIIVFFKMYLIQNQKMSKGFLGIVFLFIFDFINTLANPDFPFFTIVQWILSFWYMYEFLKGDLNLDIHDVILYFILAVWTICVVQMLEEYIKLGKTLDPNMYGKWLSMEDAAKLASLKGRQFPLRFGTAYIAVGHTNPLTLDLLIGMCLCLIGLDAKHKKHRFLYMFTFIAFFYFGFLTVSRAFYVELIFILILFFALSKKDANKFLIYIFVFLFLAIFFFVFILDNVDVLFDAVSGRFDEGSGGRDILLENSIKTFFGNDKVLFFGAGTYYPYVLGFTAHNLIFDSLVALGSFGCLIYYTLIYKAYSNLKRFGQKFNLVNYMPLIMALAYSMIYGRVVNIDYYYILSVCFMFTQYDYEGKSKICCITSH